MNISAYFPAFLVVLNVKMTTNKEQLMIRKWFTNWKMHDASGKERQCNKNTWLSDDYIRVLGLLSKSNEYLANCWNFLI